MEPEERDTSYPLFGKISIPRMLVGQLRNVNIINVLGPLSKTLFRALEDMFMSAKPGNYVTVYVTVFILLHEVAVKTANEYDRARSQGFPVCCRAMRSF